MKYNTNYNTASSQSPADSRSLPVASRQLLAACCQ